MSAMQYKARGNSLTTVTSWNPRLAPPWKATDGHDEADLAAPIRLCDVTVASAEVPRNARYMCDRTEDRANELERRNQRFIAALARADPTFDPAKQTLMASQTSVMAVGRVVCDAEAASARLNDSSVLLEGW
ncbi:unnamed protein product [Closterium sp. NIES-53]